MLGRQRSEWHVMHVAFEERMTDPVSCREKFLVGALTAALTMLSGCTAIGPDYHPPKSQGT